MSFLCIQVLDYDFSIFKACNIQVFSYSCDVIFKLKHVVVVAVYINEIAGLDLIVQRMDVDTMRPGLRCRTLHTSFLFVKLGTGIIYPYGNSATVQL